MADTKSAKTGEKVINLRDYFLASTSRFKKVPVIAKLPHPQTGKMVDIAIDLVEPSGKQRGMIFEAATTIKPNQEPEIDHAELQVWAVIVCARDPETGEPLFEPAHHDALLNLPSSIFDILAKPALSLIGENPEEEAKNS